MPTVFIAGLSSDIGKELARLYYAIGWSVEGTYRSTCDLRVPAKIWRIDLSDDFEPDLDEMEPWDHFISAVGTLAPVQKFFEADPWQWYTSFWLNGCAQLRLLQRIWPYRGKPGPAKVCFLVGAVNSTLPAYSAYVLGKVSLVKMVEQLQDEYPDDIHAVAIGTGFVKTKIHQPTVEAGPEIAGANYEATLDPDRLSTPIQDIFDCIQWAFSEHVTVTGGRNFSVRQDNWRNDPSKHLLLIDNDRHLLKLRRKI